MTLRVPFDCSCKWNVISQLHGLQLHGFRHVDMIQTTRWSSSGASEWGRKMIEELVCVFQRLLIYWAFPTQPSVSFKENGLEKKKRQFPVSVISLSKNSSSVSQISEENVQTASSILQGPNKIEQYKIGKTWSGWVLHGRVRICCKKTKKHESSILPCINGPGWWWYNGVRDFLGTFQAPWYQLSII